MAVIIQDATAIEHISDLEKNSVLLSIIELESLTEDIRTITNGTITTADTPTSLVSVPYVAADNEVSIFVLSFRNHPSQSPSSQKAPWQVILLTLVF